jgi:hypothetical protein
MANRTRQDRGPAKASRRKVPKDKRRDPLILANGRWTAARARLDALEAEWQRLERQLFVKARSLAMDLATVRDSELREAKAMRVLDRKMHKASSDLAASAARARTLRAASLGEALAKIELGLKVQGAFDWKPNARALAEEGVMEARELIAAIGAARRVH